jgi:hypothetical protein
MLWISYFLRFVLLVFKLKPGRVVSTVALAISSGW